MKRLGTTRDVLAVETAPASEGGRYKSHLPRGLDRADMGRSIAAPLPGILGELFLGCVGQGFG